MTKIDVLEVPTCTWVLDGTSFFCSHDETEVVTFIEDKFGPLGHYEDAYLGYACVECYAPLEGDPAADKLEYEAEIQLMELLGK